MLGVAIDLGEAEAFAVSAQVDHGLELKNMHCVPIVQVQLGNLILKTGTANRLIAAASTRNRRMIAFTKVKMPMAAGACNNAHECTI